MLRNVLVIGGSSEAGRFALHVDFRVAPAREAAQAVPARTLPLPGPASPSRGALRYRTGAAPGERSGSDRAATGEIRAATERLL